MPDGTIIALDGKRETHFDAKPLAVEVVQNIQQPELPAMLQTVRHEVHGPDQVWLIRDDQYIRLVPFQTLARLDPQLQFQSVADTIDTLVVPTMSMDVAQIQEPQAKTSHLPGPRQSDRHIGNILVQEGILYANLDPAGITIAKDAAEFDR